MPSGNLDEPVTATSPHAAPPRAFRLPADYYSSPPSEVRPLFPKWVALGCGTTSAVLLVILFAAGALMTGPRLALLMDFVLGTSLGELKGMYAPDVTPQQKAAFDGEVTHLRDGLRTDKVSVKNLQPFLKLMQSVIPDKKVTADEVDRLTKLAHDAVLKGKKTTPVVESPPPRDHNPLAH
jgi:hypothetical protein